MRLFLGLPVPADPAQALGRFVRTLDLPKTRWIPPENFHLTLNFLGEVTEDRLPAILHEFDKLDPAPIQLRFTRLDCFARAGVLFADVDPAPGLMRLQSQVANRMARCGFPLAERPYHPHLTLARSRSPMRLRSNQIALPPAIQRSFLVQTINLYRSLTTPTGAQYEVLTQKTSA
jgi:RNA 2',3'-cyclic 3'-phosphodiesterase